MKVAIVGRPNVGKSTLFNRIAGKKLAIVHDRPGVTRDRREAFARFGNVAVTLIDTAGFEDAQGDSLEARMREQTEAALDEADVAVFVIDARAGITALDHTFADILRRQDKPVILVANKCEGHGGDTGLMEAYTLGLGEPIATSAEHAEGIAELAQALEVARDALEAAGRSQEEAEDTRDGPPPLRIAVVGRPNAGKSTLINALIGKERVLTGPEPGVTRDSVSVRWRWGEYEVRLADTAGLRKRAKVSDAVERLSTADTTRAIRFAEVVIMVLDVANAFDKQDLQIADLALREGRALLLVVTKWDLVEDRQATLASLRERAGRLLAQAPGAPLLAVSGLTGQGLERIMPSVVKLRENWSAKIKTRDLNDWLHEAVSRHPPPAVNGRRIKPRYLTQTKSRPPTFVLICSRADQMPDAYKRYLINGIREAFDMPAIPIRLTVKASKNPYADDGANSR